MIHKNRRKFLSQTLLGTSAIGVKSLLLGLPQSFLLNGAFAQSQNATFLVFATSDEGEAVNPNTPGSYISGVMHPTRFRTPVSMSLGNIRTEAAAPWASLPQDLLNRMQFIHHNTQTNSHSELQNVMKVQGDLKTSAGNGQEMLPSAIAQMMAPKLNTLSNTPIVLRSPGAPITFNGTPQPVISADAIKSLFSSSNNTSLSAVQKFREQALDSIYSDLKQNGTKAQLKFLDDHANSSEQARNLASEFRTTMANLGSNGAQSQLLASAALFAAGITPVTVIKLGFGGDSHNGGTASDNREANLLEENTGALAVFWDRLKSLGIADKTTLCIQSHMGRTLRQDNWRGHWGLHNVAVAFGPNVRAGVSGGLDPNSHRSTAINSTTGQSGGDISFTETLGATAKTLMKMCGADEAEINTRVSKGKIIRSAIA